MDAKDHTALPAPAATAKPLAVRKRRYGPLPMLCLALAGVASALASTLIWPSILGADPVPANPPLVVPNPPRPPAPPPPPPVPVPPVPPVPPPPPLIIPPSPPSALPAGSQRFTVPAAAVSAGAGQQVYLIRDPALLRQVLSNDASRRAGFDPVTGQPSPMTAVGQQQLAIANELSQLAAKRAALAPAQAQLTRQQALASLPLTAGAASAAQAPAAASSREWAAMQNRQQQLLLQLHQLARQQQQLSTLQGSALEQNQHQLQALLQRATAAGAITPIER